ncbi:MAG: DNA translocase FtsK [Ilumatobacteraceae bacterium]|nr:DNA translocase FtsK [Ilumatobacteraceae bacterium]
MASKGTKSTPPRRPASSNGRPSSGPSARARAQRELAEAVEGRSHEFAGVALIVVGGLLALAIYFDIAGPVGSAVETVIAHVVGVGRYLVPVVMLAGGVALIKEGTSSSPFRLAVGWGATFLAVLGIADILNEPEGWDDIDEAGGVVGRVVGGGLSSLLGDAGAALLLVGVAFFGLLLVTRTSLRTFASRTGSGAVAVAAPLGRATRKVLSDLSTLSSEREPAPVDPGLARTAGGAPSLYDVADEDDPIWQPPAPSKKRSTKAATPAAPSPAPPPGDGTKVGDWLLPPLSLLARTGAQTIDHAAIEARGRILQESLESHGVETTLVGMTVGPTVTRYELELGVGVKVARVTNLQKDIAYALAAIDVRILAPIPGRSAIGVEVPNHQRQLVSLGDLLTSKEAAEATHPLDVAIGKDIAGRSVFLDLATTPHLLIAGATGAGKSSGINCIITSLLMRTTPDQVRLILIDPKQVEMGQYQRLPHLLTQPVTNPKKAANALGWAVKEMERRYDLLSEVGFRDISGYNAAFDRGELVPEPGSTVQYERLPYIVVVVDELNDLMMVAARDVEDSITRIAQKARAVGVHLIVATQRPSVNVITGVIKANIPARMAFSVSSLMDSRVILDQPGAEKLVGKGDMLLLSGSSVAQRIQGSWVSEDEVRKVVAHWRRQAPDVVYTSDVEAAPGEPVDDVVTAGGGGFGGDEDDEDAAMLRQAMELVVRSQLGSTSMLQRKLKVGFARAGRIMDLLEQRGVVGPSEGSKAREVLMTVEEFELLQQSEGR